MKKLGFGLMRLPLLDSTDPASIDIDINRCWVCRIQKRKSH